jgi:Acetyltransferase (GNAT) family
MLQIRRAESIDVPQMVALIEDTRRIYQGYQPVFWRKAENSAELSDSFFKMMVNDQSWFVFAAFEGESLKGFISAREVPVPPVYVPGGPTVVIDDFTVREAAGWELIGRQLLDYFVGFAQQRNWRQIIVICADLDTSKSAMLRSAGLTIASNWWTFTVPER